MPPEFIVLVRWEFVPTTSRTALCFAAFCCAAILASIDCDRSHHTVAFCFRIKVTYEVGLLVATDLFDVDRRGRLVLDVEPVVPCRCIFAGDFGEGCDEVERVEVDGM